MQKLLVMLLLCAVPSLSIGNGNNADIPCTSGLGVTASFLRGIYLETFSGTYESLYHSHDYHLVLEKANHEIAKRRFRKEELGWLSESVYALAEIESGNPDPQRYPGMDYRFDGSGQMDPREHALYVIRTEVGPNLLSENVRSKYAVLLTCIAKHYRESKPRFTGYFARYIAILISNGHFSSVHEEIRRLPRTGLEVEGLVGDYLLIFTERFIGYGHLKEAVVYLNGVVKYHKVSRKALTHWANLLLFAVKKDTRLLPSDKERLIRSITSVTNL